MTHRYAAFLLLAVLASAARADVATLEDQYPGPNSHQANYSGSNNQFNSGGFSFSNHYHPSYGGFTGFAVSSMVDNQLVNSPNTSADFGHQYGAYAPAGASGTGSGGSATYAVAYNYSVGDAYINLPDGTAPSSIDVANTTYVASSVKYGDQFSRAFQQGDYLYLDILGFTGLGGTGTQVGDVREVLANDDANGLYLLDHFDTVSLAGLAGARSLAFSITTNVTNSFGPSVPASFAVDNVVSAAVPAPASILLGSIGGLGLLAGRRVISTRRES